MKAMCDWGPYAVETSEISWHVVHITSCTDAVGTIFGLGENPLNSEVFSCVLKDILY